MSREVVSHIITKCDICGADIYGDTKLNHQVGMTYGPSGQDIRFHMNLNLFTFQGEVQDICPSCCRSTLEHILQQLPGNS
jgi:hypothetical protein